MKWKGHTILGLIMGLPFISSPEQIFLVVAGALYPDLDHEIKSDIVNRGILISLGLVLISLLVYILEPSYFDVTFLLLSTGVLILYLIPHLASHRGITHTFICMFVVSLILGFIAYKLSVFSPVVAGIMALTMVSSENILGKVIPICTLLWIVLYLLLSQGIHPLINLPHVYHYILPVAVGYFSHILGDCLTPAGCNALYPLNYKLHRWEAIVLMGMWIFLLVAYLQIKI
ncbi:MAG TPA: metal-dependent hydrolase [Methanothermococcus okinawensis]|uniref:Metal-dependent hydrolase n=1 Tax=Methanothermococcus okinawensis TaxID=155863 RepID=A0A833E4C5_9EURY|nr:metal-dependent hydrolase [Methanothermococcus okinawensis]